MNRFLLGGVTGAVLVGLILVAVLVIGNLRIADEQVKVPSLIGDKPSVAKAKVEALGLKVRAKTEDVAADPFGLFRSPRPYVDRQVPEGNTKVHSDATVTMFVGFH